MFCIQLYHIANTTELILNTFGGTLTSVQELLLNSEVEPDVACETTCDIRNQTGIDYMQDTHLASCIIAPKFNSLRKSFNTPNTQNDLLKNSFHLLTTGDKAI